MQPQEPPCPHGETSALSPGRHLMRVLLRRPWRDRHGLEIDNQPVLVTRKRLRYCFGARARDLHLGRKRGRLVVCVPTNVKHLEYGHPLPLISRRSVEPEASWIQTLGLIPVIISHRQTVPRSVVVTLTPVMDPAVTLLSKRSEDGPAWHSINDGAVQQGHR